MNRMLKIEKYKKNTAIFIKTKDGSKIFYYFYHIFGKLTDTFFYVKYLYLLKISIKLI